ncbi:MAG TPA: hypothetical protein VGQ36_23260 [Thermoanaerobaculia bacterium]|jgi:hypothetical protein|nr:hypothetical protein [Thermoanaerobaculia bacterium]
MPKQKDLKRVVRTRMQKTGESYTTARLHLVRKNEPEPNYAELAGQSDAAVKKATGRDWREWVAILDAEKSAEKPHRDIARYVASLGTPDWWSQTVTVGYERIRGLRAIGQRRGGGYEASKSRTFPVPLSKLYKAFSTARLRAQWLSEKVTVRGATVNKRMRIAMADGTVVGVEFMAKSETKSAVAIQHTKLPDKATADRMKAWWAERFDALSEILG